MQKGSKHSSEAIERISLSVKKNWKKLTLQEQKKRMKAANKARWAIKQ